MQTLANMSGTDSVHRQIGINLDSLSRFCAYYKRYKSVLLHQMKLVERVKQNRRKSMSSVVSSSSSSSTSNGTGMNSSTSTSSAPPSRGIQKSMSLTSIGKPSGSHIIYPTSLSRPVTQGQSHTQNNNSNNSGVTTGTEQLYVSYLDK